MKNISVVVADDHQAIRAGIRFLLQQAADIEIVGEATNGLEAMRLARELVPDVLLLDMEMPGLKGIEVARRLQAIGSPVQILALSAYDDRHYILGLLASGASGYLVKEEAPKVLLKAVRGVANGEQGWVSRRVARQIVAWAREKAGETPLSEQEAEVLRLAVEGKTNAEIAQILGIDERMVAACFDTTFTKLGETVPLESVIHAARRNLNVRETPTFD